MANGHKISYNTIRAVHTKGPGQLWANTITLVL
jgi:hypothetical protein